MVSKRTFEPDQVLFGKLVTEASSTTIDLKRRLEPDQCIGDISEYFACAVCDEVADDPKECSKCN